MMWFLYVFGVLGAWIYASERYDDEWYWRLYLALLWPAMLVYFLLAYMDGESGGVIEPGRPKPDEKRE